MESSHLAFSAAFLEPPERHAIPGEIDLGLLLELFNEPIDDELIDVLAPEISVATGGEYLVKPVLELQDRDVETASTEVVHRDLNGLRLLSSIGQGSGSGLVQDTQHLQSRDGSGILGSLSLRIVEVRGSGDDGIFHRLTEIVFRRRLQLLKDDGRELGGAIDLVVDLDVGVSVGRLDHLVGENVLGALDL